MGYRGYVRTNVVNYGASSCLINTDYETIIYQYNEILENKNKDDMCISFDAFDSQWEFEIEKVEHMLNFFKTMSEEEKTVFIDELMYITEEKLEIFISDFENWLEDGKKAETGYITIDWF